MLNKLALPDPVRPIGWAAALLLTLSACGADGTSAETGSNKPPEASTTSTTQAETTTSTTVPSPSFDKVAAAWDETHNDFTAAVQRSEPIDVDGTWIALTLSGDSTSGTATVTVWDFADAGWGRTGDQVALGYYAAGNGELVPTHDWTGDGVSDVLFEVFANDPHGIVMTNHTGDWAPASFRHSWGDDDGSESLHAEGRDLISYANDCDPSCAEGSVDQLRWEWTGDSFGIAQRDRIRQAVPEPPVPSPEGAAAYLAEVYPSAGQFTCVQDPDYSTTFDCEDDVGGVYGVYWEGDHYTHEAYH